MIGYVYELQLLWIIWHSKYITVKAQLEVVFDEERNPHMFYYHGTNEIDVFGLLETEEYDKETEPADEPLRESQCMTVTKMSFHKCESSDEDAEHVHSRHLHVEKRTALHSVAGSENVVPGQHLHPENQTAQLLAANAGNIAYSRCLCTED